MLQGQCTVLEYRPNETILAVKKVLEERLGVSPHKQRLLYQGQELKVSELILISYGRQLYLLVADLIIKGKKCKNHHSYIKRSLSVFRLD